MLSLFNKKDHCLVNGGSRCDIDCLYADDKVSQVISEYIEIGHLAAGHA